MDTCCFLVKAKKAVVTPPHAVAEEYGRPVGANPLLPSDYSRGSTPADSYRAIKRRIKIQVSARLFYMNCTLKVPTCCVQTRI